MPKRTITIEETRPSRVISGLWVYGDAWMHRVEGPVIDDLGDIHGASYMIWEEHVLVNTFYDMGIAWLALQELVDNRKPPPEPDSVQLYKAEKAESDRLAAIDRQYE